MLHKDPRLDTMATLTPLWTPTPITQTTRYKPSCEASITFARWEMPEEARLGAHQNRFRVRTRPDC